VKIVFADTFYWVALTSTGDSSHHRVLSFHRTFQPDRIVTTDEVLDEYLAFFSRARPSVRREAGDTVAGLLVNPGVLVIPQSHESFLAGLALYRARSDKSYSLTDCISMETMRHRGLTQVLTDDRHFEQEGFELLPPKEN
jgi:predicted nucleic acid-binding protein